MMEANLHPRAIYHLRIS